MRFTAEPLPRRRDQVARSDDRRRGAQDVDRDAVGLHLDGHGLGQMVKRGLVAAVSDRAGCARTFVRTLAGNEPGQGA